MRDLQKVQWKGGIAAGPGTPSSVVATLDGK